MKQVGVYEAKTNLPRLIEQVEKGETVVITRHGRPVAKLITTEPAKTDVSETIAAIREFRKGRRLDGLSIKEMINEGRKH